MRKILHALAGVCLAVLPLGCKTFDAPGFPKSEKRKAEEAARTLPARMAVVWTEAMLNNPGQPAVRGFGGRVYFYNDRGQAVTAKGQLAVYGFDDSRQDQASRVPEKKFIFTDEQLAQHLSQSSLGPSYNVWVPWDNVGGEQREISLLPVFTAPGGQPVAGEQTINVLPGPSRHKGESPEQSGNFGLAGGEQAGDVRPVGHWEQTGYEPPHRTDMRTTTIMVPKGLAQQLAQPMAPQQQRMNQRMEEILEKESSSAKEPEASSGRFSSPPAPWTPPDPRSTRFVRPRSQALGAPLAPPRPDHAQKPPYPAGPLSAPPSPIESGPAS